MATTANGIYHPNDGTQPADILTDLEKMAESIDKKFQEKQEDISKLKINDTEQDELITKLKKSLINSETEEAKSLYIEYASALPGQLEVLGNHEQKTRKGKNKLKLESKTVTTTGLNLNIADTEVNVSGTAQGSWFSNATQFEIEPNIYKFVVETNNTDINYRIWLRNAEHEILADIRKGETMELTEKAAEYALVVESLTVGQEYDITFKPMLLLSTEEDDSFEQYGASPSPDYPSSVICVGSNADGSFKGSIEIKKDNGFHNIEIVQGSLNSSTGTIIDADTRLRTADFIEIKNFNKIDCKGMTTCNVFFYDTNKTYLGRASTNWETLPFQFETLENAVYLKAIFRKNDEVVTLDMIKNLRLYSEEVDYTLKFQQEMLKGDYFVKESDGWKEVHNYNKKEFDGTEEIALSSNSNSFTCVINDMYTTSNFNELLNFYSNHYIKSTWTERNVNNKENTIASFMTSLGFYKGKLNTTDQFKQQLSNWKNEGNPLVVYYPLSTSNKLPCTEEQSTVLEQLNNLDLFEGKNNIITAEDIALLKLKYIADTKTYIDNQINDKLANINQQILNISGGN